jgi:small subunit ribosomal protein S17
MAEASTNESVVRQKQVGVVTSTFGDKTVRVSTDHLTKHPKYGKMMHRRTKLAVHDPSNLAKLGDMVEIVPCRRMSKSKNWRLLRVIRSSNVIVAEVSAEVDKG